MEMLYCEDNWQFTWGRMQYMMFVLNNTSCIFIPRLKRPSARAPEHRRQSSRLKFEECQLSQVISKVSVSVCASASRSEERVQSDTWKIPEEAETWIHVSGWFQRSPWWVSPHRRTHSSRQRTERKREKEIWQLWLESENWVCLVRSIKVSAGDRHAIWILQPHGSPSLRRGSELLISNKQGFPPPSC